VKKILLLLALLPSLVWAGPTYVAAGTASNTTAYALTVTPTIPASAVTDDIIVVVMHSWLNAAITCTANCGTAAYAAVATQYGSTNIRFAVWYRRVAAGESGAVPTPTFSQTGTANKFTAQAFVFRCVDTTTAIDVASTITAEGAATTFTGDAVTTTVAESMVVFAVGSADDNTWGTPGGGIAGGQIVYTANSASTNDNSIAIGFVNGGNGVAAAQSAPTMVQATLGADAGASLTFALRANTAAQCLNPLGSGGMMGFWP